MEGKIFTVEVNVNLRADASLIGLVSSILNAQPAEQPAPTAQPEPQPEPQPAPAAQPEPQPAPAAQPEPQPAPAAQPEPQPAPVAQPEPQPVPEPKKRTRSKKEEQAAPEPQPEPQPAAQAEPKPAEQKSYTLDDLKAAFFPKLQGHREEIRNKLQEMGVPTLSALGEDKYPEMIDFLNSLS